MPNFDVDFLHVRQNADIVAVLAEYNITLAGDGVQRKGKCPFHKDTKSSLSVNTDRNIFKCHGCESEGNIIKLVQLLDEELENPRRAALHIAKLSGIAAKPDVVALAAQATVEKPVEEEKPATEVPAVTPDTSDGLGENRPLTFKLQLAPVVSGEIEALDEFIEISGIPFERFAELEIGIGQRGSMKDRLAIPIYTKDDELVAYCGRDIGLLAGADEPTYKFPAKFHRELELYGWNAAQNFERVVLVQNFEAVVKHGGVAATFDEVGFGMAAIMGTCIADRQVELIVETRPEVIVCFAGDEAGHIGATQVASQLAHAGLWVTVRNSASDEMPEDEDTVEFCGRCNGDL